MAEFKAAKKGGPTRIPTLPGSVVPRAKIMVYSVQLEESSLYAVEGEINILIWRCLRYNGK